MKRGGGGGSGNIEKKKVVLFDFDICSFNCYVCL